MPGAEDEHVLTPGGSDEEQDEEQDDGLEAALSGLSIVPAVVQQSTQQLGAFQSPPPTSATQLSPFATGGPPASFFKGALERVVQNVVLGPSIGSVSSVLGFPLSPEIFNEVSISQMEKLTASFKQNAEPRMIRQIKAFQNNEDEQLRMLEHWGTQLKQSFRGLFDMTQDVHAQMAPLGVDVNKTAIWMETVPMCSKPYISKLGEYVKLSEDVCSIQAKLALVRVKKAFWVAIYNNEAQKKFEAKQAQNMARVGMTY